MQTISLSLLDELQSRVPERLGDPPAALFPELIESVEPGREKSGMTCLGENAIP